MPNFHTRMLRINWHGRRFILQFIWTNFYKVGQA